MIFLDISRSKAYLGAALARELIPVKHKNHRILSLARKFENLSILCECGEILTAQSTPEISYLLLTTFGALETDPYALDFERLCLEVHNQHPLHVPILLSSDGVVRCSCGSELQVETIPSSEEEGNLGTLLELTEDQHRNLSFYSYLNEAIPPKIRGAQIKRWWLSEGILGPLLRVETSEGVEDIDDPLLRSLAMKVPGYAGKPVTYPNESKKIFKYFQELKLTHHYEHRILSLCAIKHSVGVICSCGLKTKRTSKRMAETIRRLVHPT